MSSLHQDRLPAEGSKPDLGASTNLPTQRQGKAQRTRTTRSTALIAPATATTKAATVQATTSKAPATKAASAKAAALRAATAKAASAKAATVKAATAKAATAARTAAVTTVANRAAGVRSARAAAAVKPAASKSAPSKPAAPVAASSAPVDPAPVPARPAVAVTTQRPTPQKRVPVTPEAPSEPLTPVDVAAVRIEDTAGAVVEPRNTPAGATSDVAGAGRLSPVLGRRPSWLGRRPAFVLAAAAVGAIALSAFSLDEPAVQPAAQSQSVSVAEQLGIRAEAGAVLVEDETERLGELAVSRNVRDAEQAAAAQVQLEADRIAAEAAAEAARPKAVMPVEGARLTSGFGPRWGTLHGGVDLAAPMRTPEYAALDGVVLEAGPASGFGLAVYIQHENGDVTVYGHMDEILVEAGQVVRAGDTIALLGNRGQSTGPHLHFEVHVGGLDGEKIDPLPWLRSHGVDV